MTKLITQGTVLSAAAAAGIVLMSGCSTTPQPLTENTKTVEERSSVRTAFSNNRSMFSLKNINTRAPKVAVDPKKNKIQFLTPPNITTTNLKLTEQTKPLPPWSAKNNLTYQVKKGDTLSHIAVAHKVGVGELASLNNMDKKDVLYVGKMLKIPAGGIKPTNGVRALKETNVDYYTVQKGDILGRIAIKNKVSLNDLKTWNNLTSDKIFVGQKLALASGGEARSSRGGVKVSKQAIPANGIHVVESGQSISTIAYRYGMSVSELKGLNGLTTSHIVPGQKLFLRKEASSGTVASAEKRIQSVDRTTLQDGDKYTVKSGDSLSRIASRFGVAYKKIMDANGLTSTVLMPGTTLIIPTAGTKPGPTTDVSKVVRTKLGPASIAGTVASAEPAAPVTQVADITKMTKLPHFVDQQNDTLDVIAEMYGSKAEWIIAANPGVSNDTDLRSVKEISVPVKDLGL
jgi:LysM repeat protein